MEFHRIKLIIALVSFALLSLIAVQLFWAYSSYRMNEKTFHSKATDAMRKAVEAANDQIGCFEVFSKVRINPKEGIYLIRQKCDDKRMFIRDSLAIDTVPMYYANANEHIPFRHSNIRFPTAMNLELVIKFEGFSNDTVSLPLVVNEADEINVKNYREKFSSKEQITVRYDTTIVSTPKNQTG